MLQDETARGWYEELPQFAVVFGITRLRYVPQAINQLTNNADSERRFSEAQVEAVVVPWLRRLVAGLSPRRPGFDPSPVHVGFMVDKVALGQVSPRVLRFSPVNLIPPVLHYKDNEKKTIIFITRLHNKPWRLRCVRNICCGALHKKNTNYSCYYILRHTKQCVCVYLLRQLPLLVIPYSLVMTRIIICSYC
jgi:hypothetical protein